MESKTSRTILIILGILMLCCCVVAGGGFLVVRNLMQGLSSGEIMVNDPTQILQVSGEVAEYKLPSGFEEEYVMDFLNVVQGVFITNPTQGAMIMMIQLNDSIFSGLEDYQDQFMDSFLQQYQLESISFSPSGERIVEIRGQQSTVKVFEGSDADGYSYIQWVASFQGQNGTVMVVIIGNSVTWNDAEMESFLTSIE